MLIVAVAKEERARMALLVRRVGVFIVMRNGCKKIALKV